MSEVLRDLVTLCLSPPTRDAPAAVVAAWYERESTVLAHIAGDGAPDARYARDQALLAHRHPLQLVEGTAA